VDVCQATVPRPSSEIAARGLGEGAPLFTIGARLAQLLRRLTAPPSTPPVPRTPAANSARPRPLTSMSGVSPPGMRWSAWMTSSYSEPTRRRAYRRDPAGVSCRIVIQAKLESSSRSIEGESAAPPGWPSMLVALACGVTRDRRPLTKRRVNTALASTQATTDAPSAATDRSMSLTARLGTLSSGCGSSSKRPLRMYATRTLSPTSNAAYAAPLVPWSRCRSDAAGPATERE
jgi:hypothetical protein